MSNVEYDALVEEAQVKRECGDASTMTIWRWERDPALNFPPKVKIRGRNYRSRKALEDFKRRMIRASAARHNRPRIARAPR